MMTGKVHDIIEIMKPRTCEAILCKHMYTSSSSVLRQCSRHCWDCLAMAPVFILFWMLRGLTPSRLLSADTVFCQVFLGLLIEALLSTNLVHDMTNQQRPWVPNDHANFRSCSPIACTSILPRSSVLDCVFLRKQHISSPSCPSLTPALLSCPMPRTHTTSSF